MVKSPLRYPGGKSRAVKTIAPLIPQFDEFREPFLGGGSVFIYMKQKYPNKKYWINDIYSNLYYFWKYTRQNPDILIKLIQKYKDEFNDGKKLYRFLTRQIDRFGNVKKSGGILCFKPRNLFRNKRKRRVFGRSL